MFVYLKQRYGQPDESRSFIVEIDLFKKARSFGEVL